MSINTVTLSGRVGRDPEIRIVGQNNSKVAQFSLCTGGKYKTKDGREVDDTAWHNIVAWHHLAELAEKYIGKGGQLIIIGHINYRKYTDNNGVEKQVTDIVADKIELCGSRQESNPAPVQQRITSTPIPPAGEDDDTDLPF